MKNFKEIDSYISPSSFSNEEDPFVHEENIHSLDSLEPILSIYQMFRELLRKHPKHFDTDISKKTLRFLFTCPEEFCKTRSTRYVCRIIGTLYAFEKKLIEHCKTHSKSRQLLVRVLKTSQYDVRDGKRFVGLVVGTNLTEEWEVFQHAHIVKAIHRILPAVKEDPSSFYTFSDSERPYVYLYLEIKKTRGAGFSSDDLKELNERLADELKASIECLTHSLFLPRNEEEIYRNIIHLSKELKFTNDLPQVMLSFQEQKANLLRFTVIVLRILKKNTPSLEELSHRSPHSIRFIPEHTSHVGRLRKKYLKEVSVFTLEVDNSLFLRKNFSVDLRQARQHLAKALKLMIGNFRDYNGGFLSKQNEQLELIKQLLSEKEKQQAFLIETLFYSLFPPLIQTLILPQAGSALISLFLNALQQPLPIDSLYEVFQHSDPDFIVTVVKTSYHDIEQSVIEEMPKYSINSYQFGHTAMLIEGFTYLCLSYQYPTDPSWPTLITEILTKIIERKKSGLSTSKQQTQVLRINFQDGDPPSLNPHVGIDLRCRSLQKALYEGLTRLNLSGVPELAAAQKVDISSSKREYRFFLRPLQWSNGEKVTAYHFESAWKKALNPTSPCLRPDLFYVLKNAKRAHCGEINMNEIGVRAENDQILHVSLENPSPYFLELIAHPIFFPLYSTTEEPTVFNGPFVLRSWVRDQSMSLVRNPFYWDAHQVHLSEVNIRIIRDPYHALDLYERGEIDWIGNPFSVIPTDSLSKHKETGHLKSKDVLGISWLYCNTNYLPLSSANIRKALAYAIDRQKICEEELIGQTPYRSPLPKSLSLIKEDELYRDGDLDTARCLFFKGLKELNLTIDSFPPLVFLHSHIPGQLQLARSIQKQWEEGFGITVKLVQVEWNTLSSLFDSRHFHIGSCFRHFFYRDPLYIFNLFKEPTNVHNASGWKNEAFRTIVAQANEASSLNVRQSLLHQAETILIDEMPVIPTHLTTYQFLLNDKLKGISICHSGDVDFKWVYFEDGC